MTQSDDQKVQEVEWLLAEMRQAPPEVPSALSDRVLMDAQRLQPAAPQGQRWQKSFQALLEGFGGWPALGGLAAASYVGFWIGISPPEGAMDPAGFFLPLDSALNGDPAELTGFGWDVEEG
ncbi:MAG: hypothetical protein AAF999_14915 [Pseudomonadota bacterium]